MLLSLPQLPEDVLYHVLSFLDARSLSRLAQVCRATRRFVDRDAVWRRTARDRLNSGITRTGTDRYPLVSLKERVKTSQNWIHGVCRRNVPLRWRNKLLPWLQLDGDFLFLSQEADVVSFLLRQDSRRLHQEEVFRGHSEDVCRFVVTDTHLVSGGSDGRILVHSRRSSVWLEFSGHQQEVNCVDSREGVIVSGSRDRTARIWTLSSSRARSTINLHDRVWSVALSPTSRSFVTGTACCENVSPLRVWDLERSECLYCLGSEFRRGAGVLDLVFESPNQLLTCGYDTFIRLWDLRISPWKCVMEWEEPHDSALYCIRTDGNHMIASGSSYYGVVRLWDRRQTGCLQFFQLGSPPASSPVYSLSISSSHLYAALATCVTSLDFRHTPVR